MPLAIRMSELACLELQTVSTTARSGAGLATMGGAVATLSTDIR
jgi:hypothetical protein